jgi:UDP-3-O-[3-hydroxymyristoyl] glucosamine N-acyltransferase
MKIKNFTFKDIESFLPKNTEIVGNTDLIKFNQVSSVDNISSDSLDWINSTRLGKEEILMKTPAKVVICDKGVVISSEIESLKCVIKVDNPKLTFSRVVNGLFRKEQKVEIHPSAFISSSAKIGNNVSIGPFTFIGDCEIGDGTTIGSNCSIKDSVLIGQNVYIDSNTVIGSEGFGYIKNEENVFEKFPHISGVIIKDNVEIGSNTSIDRGALKPTIIEEGVKIDNLVHIAHNVFIGRNSAIIANAMIAGSTRIGENCWIAPSSSILEHLVIGNNVTVGVGAVVTKNIPDNEVWTGSPARPLKDFVKIQQKMKEAL